MIAVPTFRAYPLARPAGWPSGAYDGTFGDDGLRLFCGGHELVHVPPGTAGVRVSGAELTVPLPGGELVLKVSPPAPADARATALAFALHLAGGKARQAEVLERTYGVSCGLAALVFVPLLASLLGALLGGFLVPGVGLLTTALGTVVFRTRWDVRKRTHAAVALCVLGLMAVAAATVVGMMFRAAANPAPPVFR